MYKFRPFNAIDFYKADHRSQYPEGTNLVYSNLTPRSSRLAKKLADFDEDGVVVFGIQAFCQSFFIDLWDKEFFDKDRQDVVDYFKRRMDTSLGPDAIAVDAMLDLHDLGYFPVRVKALPEGAICPIGVPVLTIQNTDSQFFWLVNYVESVLSACLWKFMTSATTARQYRKVLDYYCEKTGGTAELVPFQGHDFSFRGMSGLEDAVMSGAGHLLSFQGTDTVLAIDFLEDYYFADAMNELVGGSVPATEHSVMCMGEKEKEEDTFKRLINELYTTGIVSIVSDTWDYWNVITKIVPNLKDMILERDGKVVIRPDSGDPVRIICGYNQKELRENYIYSFKDNEFYRSSSNKNLPAILTYAEARGSVECLWETFGGTFTDKGFKTLDSHIGLIYGDSITLERAEEILRRLADKGFSSDNIVFGIGSFTYEYVTRDTYGFAMKATYGEVNGEGREIFKDPKTDSGVKKSAKGLLCVAYDEELSKYILLDQVEREVEAGGELEDVFIDSRMIRKTTLNEIRERLSNVR